MSKIEFLYKIIKTFQLILLIIINNKYIMKDTIIFLFLKCGSGLFPLSLQTITNISILTENPTAGRGTAELPTERTRGYVNSVDGPEIHPSDSGSITILLFSRDALYQ